MIAAANVNVHYLLVPLLPSVGVIVVMALTWRSRAKRQRESEARPASRGASRASRPAADAKSRRSANAKRRRKQRPRRLVEELEILPFGLRHGHDVPRLPAPRRHAHHH